MASRPQVFKPLVTVIGATGTGKSDLAVELARKFNGEIINGDAMQLYHGLPVITNKITQGERKGIPHHLLGCIGLEEETWSVGKFVERALTVIEEIRSRGKVPILVGGTHYYTQSLLFQDTLSDQPLLDSEDRSQQFPILDESTDVILQRLKEVDPVMADRWHPNDRRKIQRSLEIYLRTGKPASQIYDEQRSKRANPSSTAECPGMETTEEETGLRFPTLIFWVHASKDALHRRLDARVDRMIENGLLDEVQMLSDFKASHETQTGQAIDQTRGIWVSIGYKEFLEYQAHRLDSHIPDKVLQKTKVTAIEKTQAATRQYANRQLRWIRIKFLNALLSARQKNKLFLLDGSDLSQWNTQVIAPALDVTSSFLSNQPLPEPTTLSETACELLSPKRDYDLGQRPDLWQKKTCDACGTVSVTANDWHLHIKSRGHRRMVAAEKKQKHFRQAGGEKTNEDMLDLMEDYQQ
ncbi:tRNA isopentenyltransferas-like protein [Aaosphaeria arxii CBS 175.79]|uniref:tRNA dimethylallyltransferase n=1 Tax=Aaosphaeria arxii CBS 175.79 TaxID=1450172 RepID=A0A6A5XNK2_9PLEO|nr:tRNA isopentenyltransferas-like protein [Aaosphaeria arxii CBS 175.79]KAF2014818.1 tRNA isopentenyltransferas-like protein [Aaosphaeria arxii CBS 175.79]